MDGLSAVSSIAGLLQIGIKVTGFVSSMMDVPSLMCNISDEVTALSAIFCQIQNLFLHSSPTKNNGTHMLYVRDVVTILTSCVCAYSELGLAVDGLNSGVLNAWDRAKWVAKERDFKRILEALQSSKLSLNLMLTIYNW